MCQFLSWGGNMREREEIKHIFQALPAQFRMFYFFSQEGMYKYFLSQSLKVAPWPSWTLYYLLQVGTTTALEVLNVLLKLMHLLEEAAELFGKIRKKKILTQEYYGQKLQLTQKLFKDFFPSFFHFPNLTLFSNSWRGNCQEISVFEHTYFAPSLNTPLYTFRDHFKEGVYVCAKCSHPLFSRYVH